MGLWALLFPSAPKRHSPGWNNANPIADIGQSWGKGNGPGGRRRPSGGGRVPRGGGGGSNRCTKCPKLQERIDKLKEQNKRLREENRRLKEKLKRREPKQKGHPGSPEWYRSGLRQILKVLNTHGRFSDYHIPTIRRLCNQYLGTNSQWNRSSS